MSIKLLVLDFDGVFTNDTVITDENGKESIICSKKDSLGISMLKNILKLDVIVISKETNKIVKKRCDKMHIECHQGVDDKLRVLKRLVEVRKITLKDVAYVGNDINDIECIKAVGFGIAVADSMEEVLIAAKIVTERNGGEGAVRDVCNMILRGEI